VPGDDSDRQTICGRKKLRQGTTAPQI
jgi:hypothetical protein